jgi:molybdenum cofactor guanylyltransferase
MLSHMSRSEQSLIERSRAGFLLAGGKSSRMGAGVDKAFMDFKGQTLLERALGAMREVCGSVMIVGEPSRFAKFGSVVKDIYHGCGPLGGVHAALMQSSEKFNLMLAVDMPFVSSELLEFVWAAAERTTAVVTVPRFGGRLQPLCAVYRRDFAIVAENALRAGNYKIDAAFAATSVRVIEEAELVAKGFSEQSFMNVNTPEDRMAAEEENPS